MLFLVFGGKDTFSRRCLWIDSISSPLLLHVYDSHYPQLTAHLPTPLFLILMKVLLSAAQQCCGDTSGLVCLLVMLFEPSRGSDRGSLLSGLFAALPPPSLLLIGCINLEGNLTRSRIPPKLTIGIVFYICPQGRQMWWLSTTSTFEYPYSDTMGESTIGRIFFKTDA